MSETPEAQPRRQGVGAVLASRALFFALAVAVFAATFYWVFVVEHDGSMRYPMLALFFAAAAVVVALVKLVVGAVRAMRGLPLTHESSGHSSDSSEDGAAQSVRFHYDPSVPRRLAARCFAVAAVPSAVVIVLLVSVDYSLWISYVLIAIMMVPAVMYVWRGVHVKRRLTRGGGLAIEISQAGIRLDGSELLPWDRIDLLLIDGRVGGYGPLNSIVLENALFGVNHIRVAVFEGDPEKSHLTRNFFGAYDRALPGGRDDFVQIARQLRGAAAAHPNVRLRIAERFQWYMKDWIGEVQAYSSIEEVNIGNQRGAERGQGLRREDGKSSES